MWNSFKQKRKFVSNSRKYPLNTCGNFVSFVGDNPKLSYTELANKVIRLASPKMGFYDVFDLVKITRTALPK